MKFGALPTLQAVVRRGTFALAAQELGLTPSAVSQQMRQLEEHFAQPLFDRSGRAVRPTPFALEVLETVEGALTGLQKLRDRNSAQVGGRLRLGVINSVQLSTLPAILRTVARRHPTLEVMLEPVSTSERLLASLKAGDTDAVVVVEPRAGIPRQLAVDPLAEEPYVLVLPPDYAGRPVLAETARHLPWIRYNISLEGGKMASAHVRRAVPGLQPKYELMTTDSVMGMVSEGLGFSVIPMPRAATRAACPARLVRLDRQIPPRSIVLARRVADVESRRIAALLDCVREVYAAPAGAD